MQLTIFTIFTVFSLLSGAFCAPIELVRRSPDLAISLRETGKNTKDWHFALVVHSSSAEFTGKHVPVHEYVQDKSHGCLVYDIRNAPTAEKHIVASANLIPKHNEATDAALEQAVTDILQTDARSAHPLQDPNYTNCFDYAIQAVHDLETHGYVSTADYAKFKQLYDKEEDGKPYHQVVRDRTYPTVRQALLRGAASSSHQSTSTST